jgi:hypothetical protein
LRERVGGGFENLKMEKFENLKNGEIGRLEPKKSNYSFISGRIRLFLNRTKPD